jgi:tetratricopeptide (TPR) repeat protein
MKASLKTLLLGVIIFMICGAPTITFDALFPAELTLPSGIKTIALIDRSQIDKKGLNIIEGGLTGEGIGQDKLGSQICIDGMFRQLNNSRRYEAVRTSKQYKNSGNGVAFPEPMDWKEIEALCSEFHSDAVISLEIFDSDFVGNFARVKAGIRLYDPAARMITDQVNFHQDVAWSQPVNNVAQAVMRAMDENQAVKDAAFKAGVRYGQRISPTWFSISRIYYKRGKGNNDLKVGARMMEVNDWDAALESLNNAMNDRHRKVKGRSAHNLAVIYEILGEYDIAKEWAQAAWGQYRNKDSKDYAYILGQRIAEINRLKMQMDEEEDNQ